AAADAGSNASGTSMIAASSPLAVAAARAAIAAAMRPEERAPYSSVSRPRGSPPPTSASSAPRPPGDSGSTSRAIVDAARSCADCRWTAATTSATRAAFAADCTLVQYTVKRAKSRAPTLEEDRVGDGEWTLTRHHRREVELVGA